MFKEKVELKNGKISLGRILEIHKMTWPLVALFFSCTSSCTNSLRMSLMSGYFSAYGLLWVVKSNTFYDSGFYTNLQYHYTIVGEFQHIVLLVYIICFLGLRRQIVCQCLIWKAYICHVCYLV